MDETGARWSRKTSAVRNCQNVSLKDERQFPSVIIGGGAHSTVRSSTGTWGSTGSRTRSRTVRTFPWLNWYLHLCFSFLEASIYASYSRERAWWSAPLDALIWKEVSIPAWLRLQLPHPRPRWSRTSRRGWAQEMREPLGRREALAGPPRRAWIPPDCRFGKGGCLLSRDRSCRTIWINSARRCTCPRSTWSSPIQPICCVTATASGCGGLS